MRVPRLSSRKVTKPEDHNHGVRRMGPAGALVFSQSQFTNERELVLVSYATPFFFSHSFAPNIFEIVI